MKLVKYPAQAVIVKLFCDCGKGEMLFTENAQNGFLHTCSNKECNKKVILSQKLPFSGTELYNSTEEKLTINEISEDNKENEISEDNKENEASE